MSKLDSKMRAMDLVGELLSKGIGVEVTCERSSFFVRTWRADRFVRLGSLRMTRGYGIGGSLKPEQYDRAKAIAWLGGE